MSAAFDRSSIDRNVKVPGIRSSAMTKVQSIVLLGMLAASRAATAQDTFTIPVPFDPAIQRDAVMIGGSSPRAELGLLAIEPFDIGRAVPDLPYTATAVTEFMQVLGDGNRIEHQTSAAIARDGRGRVRREHQATFIGPLSAERATALVSITDPTTGTHITLDQERRVAHRLTIKPFEGLARDNIKATLKARWKSQAGAPPPDGPLVFGGRGSAGVWMGQVSAHRAGEAEPVTRTENLGARDIEGVRAEGTRTTVTIPAGAIGNQAPLETVSERWYSPELQVIVLTRRSDPRFGETTYRLTNIVRGEPSADLFEIPQGYRVEEPAIAPRRKP
jgi:hypothetical protein